MFLFSIAAGIEYLCYFWSIYPASKKNNNIAPEKRLSPKRKGSSSKTPKPIHFFGGEELLVSGRVIRYTPIKIIQEVENISIIDHLLSFQTPRTFKAVRHRAARRSNAMAECSPSSQNWGFFSSGHLGPKRKWKETQNFKKKVTFSKHTDQHSSVQKKVGRFNLIMVKTCKNIPTYYHCCFFPKCLFPESIVWYILIGAHFSFNSFLMHVSHPEKKTNKSSYYTFLESAHIIYTKNLRCMSICSFPWTILQHIIHINLWQNM